jgi:hypothetical protein
MYCFLQYIQSYFSVSILNCCKNASLYLNSVRLPPNDIFKKYMNFGKSWYQIDRFCGLVVRVPSYRSRGPGFDSRRHQIFYEVVGLERSPHSVVSTIEELLGRNNSGFGLENREYGRGNPLRWRRDTLYQQKLTLTSPTRGGRSVGIVRLRTKATEFVCLFCYLIWIRH